MDTTTPMPSVCEGCSESLQPCDIGHYAVCMPCAAARHRGVLRRRCVCGRKRHNVRTVSMAGRTWKACGRCLQAIVPAKKKAKGAQK